METITQIRTRVDKSDMLGLVHSFPSQMEEAWNIGREFSSVVKSGNYRHAAVSGMGGSAIAYSFLLMRRILRAAGLAQFGDEEYEEALDAVKAAWREYGPDSKQNGALAHFAHYPELNHNEIVGWEALGEMLLGFLVISLEDQDEHVNTKNQTDVGLGIVSPLAAGVERIDSGGGGRLKRILTAMILGDFCSVYPAYLNGVNPTPVEKIDFLKRHLQELSG